MCRSLWALKVCEIKRDMSTIRHEVEAVHQVKEEMEEIRECVDKLEEQNRRRKLRLLEQVRALCGPLILLAPF